MASATSHHAVHGDGPGDGCWRQSPASLSIGDGHLHDPQPVEPRSPAMRSSSRPKISTMPAIIGRRHCSPVRRHHHHRRPSSKPFCGPSRRPCAGSPLPVIVVATSIIGSTNFAEGVGSTITGRMAPASAIRMRDRRRSLRELGYRAILGDGTEPVEPRSRLMSPSLIAHTARDRRHRTPDRRYHLRPTAIQ